ncbi:hypothetical protein ACF1BS_16325 [Streptomyces sp. NPDC014748]|uniref:hypothetical protein n=1 Tax=Streptomyces sp. NPDC014748 TaxID=3364905 RepID=UPI0036FABD77
MRESRTRGASRGRRTVRIAAGDGAHGDGRGDPLRHLGNAAGHSGGVGRGVLEDQRLIGRR